MSQNFNSKVCRSPNENQSKNMNFNGLNTALPNPQSKAPTLLDKALQGSQHASKMSHFSAKSNENVIFEAQPNQQILGSKNNNLEDVLSKKSAILEGNIHVSMSKGSNGVAG